MSTDLSRRGFLRGTLGAGATAALLSERARAEEALVDLSVDPSSEEGVRQVLLRTTVNGVPHALEVDADETALSLVRERLGLTGAKESCGHGACGACALHLNGTPVAACLLPATALPEPCDSRRPCFQPSPKLRRDGV